MMNFHSSIFVKHGIQCSVLTIFFLCIVCVAVMITANASADELVIAGPCDRSLADQYHAENPNINVVLNNEYFDSVEKLINAINFHETNFDVMILWTQNQDIETLMKKGFCLALETSPVIAEQVGQMYPAIQEAVTLDGHIFALPKSAYCAEMAYNPDDFDDAGIAVPRNLTELAALINSWADQPDEVTEVYQIAEYIEEYRSWFLMQGTERYITTCNVRGEQLQFDTEAYRSIIALQSTLSDAADFNDKLDELTPLIYSGQDITLNPKLRLLPIQMGDSLIYRGALYVAIINPYSAHQEEALKFLEWVAVNASDITKLYMYPSSAAPVENSAYQSQIEEWKNRYNEILTALEQCSEEQRRNLQTQLDEHLALREQIEKNRYLLSAEDIAAWQDAMKYMVFSSPSVYDLNPNLFIDVEFRYLDGQLPQERLISELDQIAQMIHLESN